MSRIIKKEFKCPICQNKNGYNIILSSHTSNPGLDGNPYNNFAAMTLLECPDCHYVSTDFEKQPDGKVTNFVLSREYQTIINSNKNEDIRKIRAQIALLENQDNKKSLTIWYAELGWALLAENPDEGRLYLCKYSNIIEEILKDPNEEKSTSVVLSFIDVKRQLGFFEEAKDYLQEFDEMLTEIANDYNVPKEKMDEYPIIVAEREYIKNKDSKPHRINEVIANG